MDNAKTLLLDLHQMVLLQKIQNCSVMQDLSQCTRSDTSWLLLHSSMLLLHFFMISSQMQISRIPEFPDFPSGKCLEISRFPVHCNVREIWDPYQVHSHLWLESWLMKHLKLTNVTRVSTYITRVTTDVTWVSTDVTQVSTDVTRVSFDWHHVLN